MTFVLGQLALDAVLVLMVRLLTAVLPASGSAASCDTAGLACVEIILFDSKAKVVSPVAMVAVLPVFVLVGGVVVVVVAVVDAVAAGATQFTAVSVVVQVVWFDKLFKVLLTQPVMLAAAINNEKP